MRGTPARAPYCPWLSRPGDRSPLRRVMVSWSESNDSATAQRAPPGQAAGLREPAGPDLLDDRAPACFRPGPGLGLRGGGV